MNESDNDVVLARSERIAPESTDLQDPQNRDMKLIFARYVPVLLITGTSASQAAELISTLWASLNPIKEIGKLVRHR
jgi:hypothetical protein